MNRLNKLVKTVIVFGLVFSCSSTPEQQEAREKDRKIKSLAQQTKDEIQVGRLIASKLLGTYGHYEKRKSAIRYINLVGQSLVNKVGRPELTYRFAILDTKSVNAYATPGGYIFVTKGLLRKIKSESELAGVLAHEIAHVNEKHMYKEIMPDREVSTGESITRILSRGGSDISSSLSKMVSEGMSMLTEKGLGHEFEHDADAEGALYAAAAGYNSHEYLKLIKRLAKRKSVKKSLSKTHPSFTDRISRIEKLLAENEIPNELHHQPEVLERRFKKYLTKVR